MTETSTSGNKERELYLRGILQGLWKPDYSSAAQPILCVNLAFIVNGTILGFFNFSNGDLIFPPNWVLDSEASSDTRLEWRDSQGNLVTWLRISLTDADRETVRQLGPFCPREVLCKLEKRDISGCFTSSEYKKVSVSSDGTMCWFENSCELGIEHRVTRKGDLRTTLAASWVLDYETSCHDFLFWTDGSAATSRTIVWLRHVNGVDPSTQDFKSSLLDFIETPKKRKLKRPQKKNLKASNVIAEIVDDTKHVKGVDDSVEVKNNTERFGEIVEAGVSNERTTVEDATTVENATTVEDVTRVEKVEKVEKVEEVEEVEDATAERTIPEEATVEEPTVEEVANEEETIVEQTVEVEETPIPLRTPTPPMEQLVLPQLFLPDLPEETSRDSKSTTPSAPVFFPPAVVEYPTLKIPTRTSDLDSIRLLVSEFDDFLEKRYPHVQRGWRTTLA